MWRLLLPALLGLLACSRGAPQERPLRVAAAADLQRALPSVVRAFSARTGRAVVVSYGSSGLLSRQIAEGAPFDLFCSAASEYVLRLGPRIVPGSAAVYARGQVVLVGRPGGPQPGSLAELSSPTVRRVALANPEHAPYGKAAKEALVRAGIFPAIKDKLVMADNVRQALQFAETGSVDAALVARSLTEGAPVKEAPLVEQVLGVVRGGDEAGARLLADFMRSAQGRELLGRSGFLSPGEGGEGTGR